MSRAVSQVSHRTTMIPEKFALANPQNIIVTLKNKDASTNPAAARKAHAPGVCDNCAPSIQRLLTAAGAATKKIENAASKLMSSIVPIMFMRRKRHSDSPGGAESGA